MSSRRLREFARSASPPILHGLTTPNDQRDSAIRRDCSPQNSNKRIYSYFHCACSAQQALSIRFIGSISRSVRRWITPPVTLVPRRIDLKRDHIACLRLRIPRLTSTLARSNTLAGNGLRPRGPTCWMQSSVSGLASAGTGPMMAASSRACARRACTAGQFARCDRHADPMSSSFPRPRPQRWPAIGPALDADPKQPRSLRHGEGHERPLIAQCG